MTSRRATETRAGDPAAALFLSALRQLGDHDLTFTQLAAMVYLMEYPVASLGELAEVLGRSLAATGRLASDLVSAGLVTRAESRTDRRVKQIRLTASGRSFVRRLHQRRAARVKLSDDLARSLDARERKVVHEAMSILARRGRL